MEEILKKLDASEEEILLELMKLSKGESSTMPQLVKVALPPVDLKLDGPATYLSWSHRIMGTVEGRNLEGFLTGEKKEPEKGSAEWDEWKTTHMLLYTWLLNSMVTSIVVTVDGIRSVKGISEKLRRTYTGAENNMKVFQIEREIEAMVQGEEYAIDLERLWNDYDHFSRMTSCQDPRCLQERRERCTEKDHAFSKEAEPHI